MYFAILSIFDVNFRKSRTTSITRKKIATVAGIQPHDKVLEPCFSTSQPCRLVAMIMLTNNFTNCFLLPWVASSPSRYGGEERRDAKPYILELFNDSVWVSCKVSRRNTSSGFILLNSCLIHSHSRSQICVFGNPWEVRFWRLRAIYVKQVLQFPVGDKGGLGNQERVMTQLFRFYQCQVFFSRLGLGK